MELFFLRSGGETFDVLDPSSLVKLSRSQSILTNHVGLRQFGKALDSTLSIVGGGVSMET